MWIQIIYTYTLILYQGIRVFYFLLFKTPSSGENQRYVCKNTYINLLKINFKKGIRSNIKWDYHEICGTFHLKKALN